MGLSRRRNDRQGGLQAVKRGFALLEELKLQSKAAGTIWLNGATTLKAFGNAEESVAYYEKAYENLNQYLPKEDPLWGGFFNNYALALADLDRFKEAEHLYFQAHRGNGKAGKRRPGNCGDPAESGRNIRAGRRAGNRRLRKRLSRRKNIWMIRI